MGLRIRTNVTSLVAQRQLSNNHQNLEGNLERLSSGLRINRSKDDSAGLAISENMRAKITSLTQARRNAGDATSMIQVAEGGMNEMGNILVRMRELTVQSATDTISDKDRGYLNREYQQLSSEIDRIASTTEFNGNKFFVEDPEKPNTQYTIQVGADNSPVEANKDTILIDLKGLRFSSEALGLGAGAEIGPSGDLAAPSREQIASKLDVLDSALGRMAGERANLGAIQSRLDSTINNLGVNLENLSQSRSRIVDADFAEETASLAKNRILSQASLSVLSQANQTPDMALTLLRT